MSLPDLYWLPAPAGFDAEFSRLKEADGDLSNLLPAFASLANTRLDFLQTGKLDRLVQRRLAEMPGETGPFGRIKLAILASATVDHLIPAIRVGALRRNLIAECYLAPYGQYHQEVLDPSSGLHSFDPDVVFFALDSQSLIGDVPLSLSAADIREAIEARVAELTGLWSRVRETFKASVIQQLAPDRSLPLFGNFEACVASSPGGIMRRLNAALVDAAAESGVLPLDLAWFAGQIGCRTLSDPMLWHHAKQEVSPAAAPLVGDLVARQLAAVRGLSKKCLVLDLDNTLWGGVVGDDGLEGIVLGQGSARGEAFCAFQSYVKQLSTRGIVLTVSSKNDQQVAESVFDEHPEMVLRRGDIAVLEANWGDKPSSLRRIAQELDLGLDSFVFFDDNPAERSLVRETLPMVAVPEVPDSPEAYAQCLVDAGYFEATAFTAEDTQRSRQYVANQERKKVETGSTDIESFLRNLEMEIRIAPFDGASVPRVTQLVNKTNQFNLTTRRYTEAEVIALMEDPTVEARYVRLKDRFGDNGIISVVIGRMIELDGAPVLDVDTWLMSCRVLGRRVEQAVLDELVRAARHHGARAITGSYAPTPRNGMVRDHYPTLGFEPLCGPSPDGGETRWIFRVDDYESKCSDIFRRVERND